MNAIVYHTYGSPEVLQYTSLDEPLPQEHEVLVAVHAASLNSADLDMLSGKPYLYRLLYGLFNPSRKILGSDIAGKIVALGGQVKNFKVGDEVLGDLSAASCGAFAQYVCAPEKALTSKPRSMSFSVAAALPQAAVLAMQALCDKRSLREGDQVLINGAGGGMGTFAVQLAKMWGAEVTAVDSLEKLDVLRTLGADYVIDYRQEDFTTNGKKYDLVIEVVAHRSIGAYKRCLKPDGIFVLVGGSLSSILQTALLGPLFSLFSSQKLGILIHEQNKYLSDLVKLVDAGTIKAVIDKTYSLEETSEAFRALAAGKAKGKLVVKVVS